MESYLKIVILGDSSVGKSSLLANKYYSGSIEPNLGTNFITKEVIIDDNVLSVQFWDMPGLPSLRSRRIPYYRGADCCVLVYDVTSLESFESLDGWRNEFLAEISIRDEHYYPFVVIGNKIDLDNRTVDQERPRLWIRDTNVMPYSYFETSAKYSINVKKAFQKIVNNALNYNKQKILDDIEVLNEHKSQLRCCSPFSCMHSIF